ncbi:MAG: cation:proton antiporter [Desulfovibrionaceae bacterium]|nr:cation:proton antiporter [Desulfovibrionaceae bacterium]
MSPLSRTFLILGGLLIVGLATDALGRRTRLPRVTLLLIFGFLAGPGGFALLVPGDNNWAGFVSSAALVMIGFLLGGRLTLDELRRHGRQVLCISVAEVVVTAVLVLAGLVVFGAPLAAALTLAGISTATAPAATSDVVREQRAKGPFSRVLLGVVAVDDAWGLMAFSLLFTLAQVFGLGSCGAEPLLAGLWEVGGAILVGAALGLPMAFLTGRIRPGEPTFVEALGCVFLCAGVALWLKVSFLLAAMTMGFVVANLARHHVRPFHAIESIEWPFLVLFFILAGAMLDPSSLAAVGSLGLCYMLLRVVGRISGAWLGAVASAADRAMRRFMGLALMPQAGVAMGMAIAVQQRCPELGRVVLPVVVASTVIFELIGPALTRLALVRAGEARKV